MNSYKSFAECYDVLTKNVDYKAVCDYINGFILHSGIKQGARVLDLGCGTGTMVKLFHDKGFMLTGIDLSPDMLTIACAKCPDADYICCSIDDFDLPIKQDVCISVLDCINHLDGMQSVKKCFSCVYDTLNDGGLFIFDVNTMYKHKNILANKTFVFDEQDFFLAWDNEYTGGGRIRLLLDIFFYNRVNYDRYSEEFYETAYDLKDIDEWLDKAGFDVIGRYDEWGGDALNPKSERASYVCKKR